MDTTLPRYAYVNFIIIFTGMCNTAVNSCARAPFPPWWRWWHGNHRDFVTFCRHCEPLLCSQVAFQAYEDVPNPTKKKMGQKWRRTKTQARKWYHHVFTAFFQCYCMQPRLQMALLKVKLVFFFLICSMRLSEWFSSSVMPNRGKS